MFMDFNPLHWEKLLNLNPNLGKIPNVFFSLLLCHHLFRGSTTAATTGTSSGASSLRHGGGGGFATIVLVSDGALAIDEGAQSSYLSK
ncbi:hypothetical protein VIGAN_03176700 [Vigna angularis var. angularis]|uniref:Uncharacterized protein n=1 Tax=Vigna angularis var. angularis TaxID=157739 RepID=A0A0S3RMM8_PHAAN|nr:hypothetical protein VIGAN_03176700 [Vigna angularis var. angularis]